MNEEQKLIYNHYGQDNLTPRTQTVLPLKFMKKICGQSRETLFRLKKIFDRVQENRFPSCRVLATELEVSEKTIQRDISYLTLTHCLPIAYNAQMHGYYLTEPVANFPLLQLTENELVAIFIAEKAIAQYAGTPFEQPLKAAFKKFSSGLDEKMSFTWSDLSLAMSVKPFEVRGPSVEVFKALTRAVRQRKEVSFDYRNLGTETYLHRRVRPLHLACINGTWYLIAHCLLRNDTRTFVLTRLKALELHSKTFCQDKGFKPNEHLRKCFAIFSGKDSYKILLEFDRFATQLLSERMWHPSQTMELTPEGGSSVSFTLSALEEIESWILSWGVHVVVKEPIQLVERIKNVLTQTTAKYLTADLPRLTPTAPKRLERKHRFKVLR